MTSLTPSQKLTIVKAVDTLTGKPTYKMTVPIKQHRSNLLDWIKRTPKPTHKTFIIRQAFTGNVMRISALAGLLPAETTEDGTVMFLGATEHLPTMIQILAIAIQNDRYEPDEKLVQFIEDNFDNEDMALALNAAIGSTDMQSFSISTILIKSTVKILAPMDL